jgi:hypothetical protein
MSETVSAAFLYPFIDGQYRVVEPPGLTQNVGQNWSRIRVVNDLAIDVAPDTRVMTDQGWLLPSNLIGRKASLQVQILPKSFSFKNQAISISGARSYKVVSVSDVPENEARVNRFSLNVELGGDPDSETGDLELQNPIPQETCECVLTNSPCDSMTTSLSDFVSYPI